MPDRVSYSEFRKLLLIHLAALSRGNLNQQFDREEVSSAIDAEFDSSWSHQAAEQLKQHNLVRYSAYLDGGGRLTLNGAGLEQAEQWLHQFGWDDLDEVLEPAIHITEAPPGTNDAAMPETDPREGGVISIDPHSQPIRDLQHHTKELVQKVRSNNAFMAQEGDEAERMLNQLELSIQLTKVREVDPNLYIGMVRPALDYLKRKVAEKLLEGPIETAVGLMWTAIGAAVLNKLIQ